MLIKEVRMLSYPANASIGTAFEQKNIRSNNDMKETSPWKNSAV